MPLFVQINGKTRLFNNIIDYLEATEDGFQDLIAEDIGQYTDFTTLAIATGNSLEIEGEIIDEWTPDK